ncbi:MAG: hypothetical protein ACFFEK_17020 [Candidatus Thorarchaeota archaeon]
MSEEIDIEELSKEIKDLRERVNCQRLCLGGLSVVVIYLLFLSISCNPLSSYYLVIIAVVIIPLALVISRLEQLGL